MRVHTHNLGPLFAAMADYDHNDLNHMLRIGGQMQKLSVRMELNGKKTIEGSVELMPIWDSMEPLAAFLFENVCNEQGMYLEWDKAVVGKNKIAVDHYHESNFTPIVDVMKKHDRSKSLTDNIAHITQTIEEQSVLGHTPPTQYEKGILFAASFVAATACVKSKDLERFVFDKKRAFGSSIFGFNPRGLEF